MEKRIESHIAEDHEVALEQTTSFELCRMRLIHVDFSTRPLTLHDQCTKGKKGNHHEDPCPCKRFESRHIRFGLNDFDEKRHLLGHHIT